jgi:hypothetical protein
MVLVGFGDRSFVKSIVVFSRLARGGGARDSGFTFARGRSARRKKALELVDFRRNIVLGKSVIDEMGDNI